jgi:ATP-dependent protease ClpP protease subunit
MCTCMLHRNVDPMCRGPRSRGSNKKMTTSFLHADIVMMVQVAEIERVMDRDTHYDAQQAIAFGVVDAVLTKRNPITDGKKD